MTVIPKNPICQEETGARQYGSGWTPHLTWVSVGLLLNRSDQSHMSV